MLQPVHRHAFGIGCSKPQPGKLSQAGQRTPAARRTWSAVSRLSDTCPFMRASSHPG